MRLLTLAARNLVRNTRRTLLTVSAIGFGLGMMIWIIVMTTGQYKDLLKQGISSTAGHVVVEHAEYRVAGDADRLVTGVDALTTTLQEAFPDATVAARIQLAGLLTSPANNVGVGLRGVDPVAEAAIVDLDDQIVDGTWLEPDDERGILIGQDLADRLGVAIGEKLVFMGQLPGEEVQSRLFRVRGIFRTGAAELDAFVAIADRASVAELIARPDTAHQVTLHLDDPTRADAARETVADVLTDPTTTALTWQEALPDLVAFIQMDRVSNDVMMVVLGLIVAMGVLNTVLMSVLERTREFGVLLAIGMRPRRIGLLVLLEGFVLGVAGTLAGLVLGGILGALMVRYGIDYTGIMGETMEMEGVVVSAHMMGAWDPGRIARYCVAAVALTMLSAAYPAWYITRLKPVDAMRHV
jgi:ABC-type lipoprotein release transport system permease subunit